jgi:hypothetical protein
MFFLMIISKNNKKKSYFIFLWIWTCGSKDALNNTFLIYLFSYPINHLQEAKSLLMTILF